MNKIYVYKDFKGPDALLALRRGLFSIWMSDPCSLFELSRRIGINYPSLRRFMMEESSLRTTSLYKITSFVENHKDND